jgi:hypothetical protein
VVLVGAAAIRRPWRWSRGPEIVADRAAVGAVAVTNVW